MTPTRLIARWGTLAVLLLPAVVVASGPTAGQVQLPIEGRPAAWLHAFTDVPVIWTTLPASSPREQWQTHAFHFTGSGEIELQPEGGGSTFTHLRLSVRLLPSGDRLQPAEDDVPPHWIRADGPRVGGAARISVQVHDRVENRSGTVVEKSIEGYGRAHDLDVALPFPLKPGACALLLEVTTGDATQALVYRIAPYEKKQRPKRVLLISLDTHALQMMSLGGPQVFDTSPALTRLIEQEPRTRLFTGSVAASNWTLPTHATIFSGLYPTQHGLIDSDLVLAFSEKIRLLPELLQDCNVATYHLISHTRIGFPYGYHRGVDVYRLYEEPLGRRGRRVLHDAVGFLERERGRDVFMFLHLFDAHLPYANFPADYKTYYKGVRPESPDRFVYSDLYKKEIYGKQGWRPDRRAGNLAQYGPQVKDMMAAARAAYLLGLRDVDDMLATFFQRLQQGGLWEDTSILITSDHGEEFFEHGLMTHTSLYSQNLAVPFVLKLAANAPGADLLDGSVRRVPYSFEAHTTAFQAVLDLFSVQPPPHLEGAGTGGVRLAELLQLGRHRPAFAEFYVLPTSRYHEASLVTPDRRKFIYSTVLDVPGQWQQRDTFAQLYDLSNDSQNARNLFDAQDPEHVRLRDHVAEKARMIRQHRFVPSVQGALSPAQIEKLRALGYIR